MNKKTIYYTLGGLVILTGIGVGIKYLVKNINKSIGDGKKGDLDEGGTKTVKDLKVELVDTFVNIRSTPEIDNKNYCNETLDIGWDCEDNILEVRTNNNVGTILESIKSGGYFWYKIAIGGDANKIGYVREDAVKVVK